MTTAYDWRADAACLESDPELFFAVGESGPALRQIREAKMVCETCPVRDACLSLALEIGASGIWGGLSDDERRRLKRTRARAS